MAPDACWDDMIEDVRFRRVVEIGSAPADRDSFAMDDEVRNVFARCAVKI